MPWPAQNLDLNIIEDVWDYLNRKKTEMQPRNADECFQILYEKKHKTRMIKYGFSMRLALNFFAVV